MYFWYRTSIGYKLLNFCFDVGEFFSLFHNIYIEDNKNPVIQNYF